MFSFLNERTVGVTQEINGKQFMQPEIVRCTSRRVVKKSRNVSEAAKYDASCRSSRCQSCQLSLVSESQIIPAGLYSDILSMC